MPPDLSLHRSAPGAEFFGSRHLHITGPFAGTVSDAARAFARVCDRAAEVGLLVAIEFLPPNNIPDAGVALDIAERAGRPNGGVCIDAWHHFRGARRDALLRRLPVERIISIQLSDGTVVPREADYIQDCLHNRMPLGEGEFDLLPFLALLDEIGAQAPRSFEVISTELEALPHREAAERIATAARRYRR